MVSHLLMDHPDHVRRAAIFDRESKVSGTAALGTAFFNHAAGKFQQDYVITAGRLVGCAVSHRAGDGGSAGRQGAQQKKQKPECILRYVFR